MKKFQKTDSFKISNETFLTDIKNKKHQKNRFSQTFMNNKLPKVQNNALLMKNKHFGEFLDLFKKKKINLSKTADKKQQYNSNRGNEAVIANEYLLQQKKKIQNQIKNYYEKRTPQELQNFLNNLEKKNSVKDLLEGKNQILIKLQQHYNNLNFRKKKIQQKMKGMNQKLECLEQKQKETQEKIAKKESQNFDQSEIEYEIQKITLEKEQLENYRNHYKDDIILIKKKSQCLRDNLFKYKKRIGSMLSHIKQLEHQNNKIQTNAQNQLQNNLKFFSQDVQNKIDRQLSIFEEQVKFQEIQKNEDLIKQVIESQKQVQQQIKLKQEKEERIEQMNQNHQKLKQLQQTLQEKNKFLQKFMKKININKKNQILSKILQLKYSNEQMQVLQKDFKKNYEQLNIDNDFLRDKLEQKFLLEIENLNSLTDFKDLKVQETQSQEEIQQQQAFERNILFMDDQLKNKNLEFFNKTIDLSNQKKLLLNCASTISRIIYQLDKKVSSDVQITNDNIESLLSYIGIQLEKIIQFTTFEGRYKELDSNIELKGAQQQLMQQEPPQWLRINSAKTKQNKN